MTDTTENLFTKHVAEQADHELVIVRKVDVEERRNCMYNHIKAEVEAWRKLYGESERDE
jgi:hypothetical protein